MWVLAAEADEDVENKHLVRLGAGRDSVLELPEKTWEAKLLTKKQEKVYKICTCGSIWQKRKTVKARESSPCKLHHHGEHISPCPVDQKLFPRAP